MKKIISTLLIFTSLFVFVFSNEFTADSLGYKETQADKNTQDAGMTVPEEGIRSGNEGMASEEFRRGVQAYYRGAYNEAVVQFEKALSYLPNDNLILDWLGKAYYKTGLEGTALTYWQTAADNDYGGLLLQNKIEVVRERRVTGDSKEKLMRLSEAGTFPGDFNGNLVFSGPVAVQPNYDGTMWVAAYNSNELLLLNQNGTIIFRNTGPINGFDRPSDIIRLHDGSLLVSENAGDRLALLNGNGGFIKYIGSKGRGNGQMVGPLYLAQDYLERIYVTDYGNRRVDVFDKDGNPLFFFGGRQADFQGLKGPTGIAIVDESVFVADDQVGIIYEFDRAGNFVRELVEPKTFKKPDSIKIWNESLIICDSNRIVSVDKNTGAIFEYAKTGNGPSRVTTAAPDVNGNVVVSDFVANEVYVMSKLQELVGGLFVQIEKIDASAFPNVTVEVRVENRHRQPVVGLQYSNFYLTENKQPVANCKLNGSASNNTEADVTILIDRSISTTGFQSEIETAVREIVGAMNGQGYLRIVSAGTMPAVEYEGSPDLLGDFRIDSLRIPVSPKISVDTALRLCSNDLINASKKRAIIMITAGDKDSLDFKKYNLAELTAYMSNNSVAFSVVNVNQSAISPELAYVVDNTPGDTYYVYRPQGLGDVVKDIIEYPQGIYQLSYTSGLQTNFGTKYLPIETEVYLLNRSGRDETGYFAPLQ